MKKKTEKRERNDELRREYDLAKLKGGIRGKYVARYRAGTNLVLLSPDIAEYFPDVNTALRGLIRGAKGLSAARAEHARRKNKKQTQKPHSLKNETASARHPIQSLSHPSAILV